MGSPWTLSSQPGTSTASTMNGNAQTNKTVLDKFLTLEQKGRVQAFYIWIDGTGQGLRGKTKTLDEKPKDVKELPIWNYDGSSTYQAEVILSCGWFIVPILSRDWSRAATRR